MPPDASPHSEPDETMAFICRDIVSGWVSPNVAGDVLKLRMAQAYLDLEEQLETAHALLRDWDAWLQSVAAEEGSYIFELAERTRAVLDSNPAKECDA